LARREKYYSDDVIMIFLEFEREGQKYTKNCLEVAVCCVLMFIHMLVVYNIHTGSGNEPGGGHTNNRLVFFCF
jgi:hypothetical protein